MSAQDVERLRGALESAHWMEAIIECSAADLSAERLGFSEPDAVYRGHEGLREWFRDLQDVYVDFRLEPEAYFDLGEQTLVLSVQQGRGRYSGAAVSMPIAQTFRWLDDKIVHLKTYGRRDDALEELGLTEASLLPTRS
jgi:ketosteroid isomerase-like protein